MIKFILSTQNKYNTEKEPFGIWGVSTEHQNDLRVKTIVESEICFMLEIYRYSCE